ncbi:hypothetical protein A3A20_02255 [Candidatus Wolfebacteria bacterium RIFCSPLOWO2_01_FULL_45_19]|uniref:HAD-IB family hydrolase n=1 Tax=Candidatus Wolfebacteria bacterium RIFCSPLOWO2_01_FULL_45_19 TaxID=1802557 RepID=A0A1F8DT18_9BACT|nr:MAG: hypothetical protein UX23_C0001G0089 [Parcubacteria group bacterium GW2011_GWB1_45_9]OGM91734.1 MAG: hypothetical protein A3A20_02255 [Candidatus Wolfebacteria bacterium RIFCSPLOWO2_01_FULL_45_19]
MFIIIAEIGKKHNLPYHCYMKKQGRTFRKVAVFDIDGTIFRSSFLIEITEALVNEGVFPPNVRSIYVNAYRKWLHRRGNYRDFIDRVIFAFEKHIKGVPKKTYLKVAKKVVSFHKKRVYRYTRDLIGELRRRNYYLLAISHSPKEIVDSFAKELGFNKVYGWVYEVGSERRFTGRTLYSELIRDKARILKRAVEKNGLTLRNSVGVGDTETDIAFLKMVDKPIAFNPNSKLYRYAKRAGWKIVVERKDVIYKK